MELVRYIILIEALFAFIVAGGLFFREFSLKSTTIAILMAMFGVHMLIFLYGSGAMVHVYPQFSGWIYYELGFLFGPVLFVHLQALIFNKKRLRWYDLLHLSPIIFFWIGYGDVLLMPGADRRIYVIENFLTRTMTWNYILAIQLSLYAILCAAMVAAYRDQVSRKRFAYALLLVGIYMAATAIVTWLTWFAEGWRDFSIYYLVISMIIFVVGYLVYTDPQFFKIIRKKYLTSNLDSAAMSIIQKKIEAIFKKERLFLNNDLSIKTLSRHIDEKPYHVSQTFSEGFKENFNDYVNRHRVSFSERLLQSAAYDQYKIEAIALEAGFNNKVTFYKAFTKFMNETPSRYRKIHRDGNL